MSTFAEQQSTLNGLFQTYQDKLTAYNKSLAENNQGHANQQNGVWVFPYSGAQTDEASFYNWLAQSDSALTSYKQAMESAKKSYEDYKKIIDDLTTAQYASTNPTLYADIIKNKDLAEANAAATLEAEKTKAATEQTKLQIEAQTASFAAKNKQAILYVGIALTVIVVGVAIYLKFKKK